MKAEGIWAKIVFFLPIAIVALGLVCGFILPIAAAGVMDTNRLGRLAIIDTQNSSFEDDAELSQPERIALAANPNTETLVAAAGQVMEAKTAESRAVNELTRFFRNGPFEFTSGSYTIESSTVSFIVDMENPAKNLTAWEFKIIDQNSNEATVVIDDETGLILKLIYMRGDGSLGDESNVDKADYYVEIVPDGADPSAGKIPGVIESTAAEWMRGAATRIAGMMTEYYGVPVELGDYEHRGGISYYMVYMTDGETDIPMYGVIRETGFTTNEKP